MNRIFCGGNFCFILIVIGSACFFSLNNVQANEALKIGGVISNMQLHSIVGLPTSLRPPSGKYLLIQFWNIEAKQTQETVEQINLLYKRFHDAGLSVIGICVNDSEDDVEKFAETQQILWPLVMNQQDNCQLTEIYEIKNTPSNVLIDSAGKILAAQLTGIVDHKTVADVLGVSLDDLPLDEIEKNWKETFYSVYRLEDNEALKRIPPPYIPERLHYYAVWDRSPVESLDRGPSVMVLHWDGRLKARSMIFGMHRTPLKYVLRSPLDIASFEIDAAKELLDINLPGDWIVRKNANTKELLQALQKICKEEMNQSIRFELRNLEREVVVAWGEYSFRPLDGLEKNDNYDIIHVFSDASKIRRGGGGGSGTLKEFLREFGDRYHVYIVDETKSSQTGFSYRWRQDDTGADRDTIDGFLDILSKQTSIRFKKEKRIVPVWTISTKEE